MAEFVAKVGEENPQYYTVDKLQTLADTNIRLTYVLHDFKENIEELQQLLQYNPNPDAHPYPVLQLLTYDSYLPSEPKISKSILRDLLRPQLGNLIEFFNNHPEHNVYLGYLLTLYPVQDLANFPVLNISDVMKTYELELFTEFGEWSLCPASEDRLIESLIDSNVMLLDDTLVLKFIGKITAYCLKDFTNEAGLLFKKGYWYSPIHDKARSNFRRLFLAGETRTALDKSSWVYMRPASTEISQLHTELDLLMNQSEIVQDTEGQLRVQRIKVALNRVLRGNDDLTSFHSIVEYFLSRVSNQKVDLKKRVEIIEKKQE